MPQPRVLIVAEHASLRFGGEAALPLHYFRVLSGLGIYTRLITHSRVRDELLEVFPAQQNMITFIEESFVHKALWRLSQPLPARLSYFTLGFLSRLFTQIKAAKLARKLVAENRITVVHQPMPVSPREPSVMRRLGAPVVIGPLNGNIDFPPAYSRQKQPALVTAALRTARVLSEFVSRHLFKGKQEAAALIVANRRTAVALPRDYRGRVERLPENGVDTSKWAPCPAPRKGDRKECHCIFVGRLVDVKAVDLLIRAFGSMAGRDLVSLTIVGDGPERKNLVSLARRGNLLADHGRRLGMVHFAGWKSQDECAAFLAQSDVFVLPSLCECGGAVILEAMAAGLPVVATDWGGPADYLDESCGILVPPNRGFQQALGQAILKLAADPELRVRLGAAGRAKVLAEYDWNRKVETMIRLYEEVAYAS